MSKRVAMAELSPIMEQTISQGGEVIFTITGNSMAPLLYHRRDKVCIIKPSVEALKKYDIPLYIRKDGKFILHRIVGLKDKGYVTIGDNQYVKEYPVEPSQVIGVVKGLWRHGKYISCENFWYKVYCRFWGFTFPLRKLFLTARRILS